MEGEVYVQYRCIFPLKLFNLWLIESKNEEGQLYSRGKGCFLGRSSQRGMDFSDLGQKPSGKKKEYVSLCRNSDMRTDSTESKFDF